MEETDFVLSDVHIGSNIDKEAPEIIYHSSSDSHQIKVGKSRFEFKLPSTITCTNENATAITLRAQEHLIYDEDGDIEVPRNIDEIGVITIEHSLGSPLSLVGLQVWNGALFLSDYLLNIHEQLPGKIVLELGAGSGLSSIVSSKFAKLTICTDTKDEILKLCQNNILQNSSKNKTIVKDLDWCNPFEVTSSSEWSWTKDDIALLQRIDFIIAADVIYSDNLTDSFFKLLQSLLQSEKSVTVILSIEKRLNFSLEDLDVCCPAYNHFREWIIKLESSQPHIQVFQVEDNIVQYFKYQRTKYLEIWKFVTTTSTS